MRERAASIGATLEIVSAPGRGTRVRCTLTPETAEARGTGASAVPETPAERSTAPFEHAEVPTGRSVTTNDGGTTRLAPAPLDHMTASTPSEPGKGR